MSTCLFFFVYLFPTSTKLKSLLSTCFLNSLCHFHLERVASSSTDSWEKARPFYLAHSISVLNCMLFRSIGFAVLYPTSFEFTAFYNPKQNSLTQRRCLWITSVSSTDFWGGKILNKTRIFLLLSFTPTYALIYIIKILSQAVTLVALFTPTCFDPYGSSSGSTAGPY